MLAAFNLFSIFSQTRDYERHVVIPLYTVCIYSLRQPVFTQSKVLTEAARQRAVFQQPSCPP
jgi:hypothetical protein